MLGCSEYGYIEIVCMQRYPIKLTMKTGEVFKGIALDTSVMPCVKSVSR